VSKCKWLLRCTCETTSEVYPGALGFVVWDFKALNAL